MISILKLFIFEMHLFISLIFFSILPSYSDKLTPDDTRLSSSAVVIEHFKYLMEQNLTYYESYSYREQWQFELASLLCLGTTKEKVVAVHPERFLPIEKIAMFKMLFKTCNQ